jgi:hypothetical protein
MLGKLLKYEVKSTARILIPMYMVLLLFGLINRFINPFNVVEVSNSFTLQNVLRVLTMILYIGMIIGTLVMTFIIMLQRFYKNLLGDEGYLMFTLPVKSWQHVVTKLLVSMMWMILSFLTVICSILIIAQVENLFGELSNAFNMVRDYAGNAGLLLIIIVPLISMIYSIITIYDAMAVGHLFSKHRIFSSFGAYIVFYMISQVSIGLFMFVYATSNMNLFSSDTVPQPSQIMPFVIGVTCIYLVLAAGHFIVANTILKKKLNLE